MNTASALKKAIIVLEVRAADYLTQKEQAEQAWFDAERKGTATPVQMVSLCEPIQRAEREYKSSQEAIAPLKALLAAIELQ